MDRRQIMMDGNQAAASVAFRLSDNIVIYPITPSSTMGEWADEWSCQQAHNIWGSTPQVTEMQSEGGAAGALHGAAQAGSLTATFTASQGLLLMIPNMFKMAGELTPTVFHVSARTVASHALSIFGDHSDVMATRGTGFAMLCSGSVQEVMDFAAIAHAATLSSRVPFLHFFDGFRTSHEIMKIEQLGDGQLRELVDVHGVIAHRARSLNPSRPVLRGSAQNPDVFFQAREAGNPFFEKCPKLVQRIMDHLAELVGRQYHLFDYVGSADAERVIVMMGSGAETAHEVVDHFAEAGCKIGLVKVRLFRPFSCQSLIEALPETTKSIAVLDRTKEPGCAGEPLYQDVVTAIAENRMTASRRFADGLRVLGGRYGLSSKEFTPAMVLAVFDELAKKSPKNHFAVGINDDVTNRSLEMDKSFVTEDKDAVRAVFYGLGSDGTVGANKNSVKIIGEETENFAQGYFVYDSRKAGSVTVSHLRFGKRPIRSTYLVQEPTFVACHQDGLIDRFDLLKRATKGSVFLLNTKIAPDQAWASLPREMQEQLIAKNMRFFVIDAYSLASDLGLGSRINTIMQTCFFAISGVLSPEEAVEKIKAAIRKTYHTKGETVVQKNCTAVDGAIAALHEVKVCDEPTSHRTRPSPVPAEAPAFVRDFTARLLNADGDNVPVSQLPVDGTFPVGTAKWEKRNLAHEIPVWDEATCIQCNKCALVCPHAAIRPNVYAPALLDGAPAGFKSTDARGGQYKGLRYTLQVAPEDCTGCGLCVEICPAKNKTETRLKAINLRPQRPIRDTERQHYNFFLSLPEFDRTKHKVGMVKDSQFMLPLFEYSGACVGCGETPYIKLVSQLFGDRAIIANATGCSSIYGGNLPTTPWTANQEGRGPAWSNSLFEDNAEFGLGMRLSIDKQQEYAKELLRRMREELGADLVDAILNADQSDEAGLAAQRKRVADLKQRLAANVSDDSENLKAVADTLCTRSVWIIGGDGWAYDIGYGGLDHVLASGRNVNVLVLDTEVYSNTGGQMSKATPFGAVAKFAAGGKRLAKKDLGMLATSYGHVYVAQVAMGANDNQTVKAITEAECYDGPSLIIAYSHCIAHGINMRKGLHQQKLAVDCGQWLLYRYDPRRALEGRNPLQLDSKPPSIPSRRYMEGENRFRVLLSSDPARADSLLKQSELALRQRYDNYVRRAEPYDSAGPKEDVGHRVEPQRETASS